MRKAVSLAYITYADKMLLYLRDDKPDISYPGYWSLLGGQIEERETPEMALAREIREEIGCSLDNNRFVCKIEVVNNPMCEDHKIFLFQASISKNPDELVLTEGQRLACFSPEEFRSLWFPDFLRDRLIRESLIK